MTIAHDQRGNDNKRQLICGEVTSILLPPAPPLDAANDNRADIQLVYVAEDCDSVTSVQSRPQSSVATIIQILVCAVMILIIAAGWLYITSVTLLDVLKWTFG